MEWWEKLHETMITFGGVVVTSDDCTHDAINLAREEAAKRAKTTPLADNSEVYAHNSCIYSYCPQPDKCENSKHGCLNPA